VNKKQLEPFSIVLLVLGFFFGVASFQFQTSCVHFCFFHIVFSPSNIFDQDCSLDVFEQKYKYK
jgi:hypothetical protein